MFLLRVFSLTLQSNPVADARQDGKVELDWWTTQCHAVSQAELEPEPMASESSARPVSDSSLQSGDL